MTLLYYTVQCLEENGKTLKDIIWIGNQDFRIDINEFINYSMQLEMDSVPLKSYKRLKSIPIDIVIVGKDFWLSRPIFYDESFSELTDLWIFNTMPEMPDTIKKIRTLSAKYLPKNVEWEKFNVTLDDLAEK